MVVTQTGKLKQLFSILPRKIPTEAPRKNVSCICDLVAISIAVHALVKRCCIRRCEDGMEKMCVSVDNPDVKRFTSRLNSTLDYPTRVKKTIQKLFASTIISQI